MLLVESFQSMWQSSRVSFGAGLRTSEPWMKLRWTRVSIFFSMMPSTMSRTELIGMAEPMLSIDASEVEREDYFAFVMPTPSP